MEKQNFENLQAWIKAKELCILCYSLTKKFPHEEKYALSDQINRASVSVPSNIAEGYSRKSSKDLSHFFHISTGSVYELMTQIDIAKDLGYITTSDKNSVFNLANDVLKLICGFIKYVNK